MKPAAVPLGASTPTQEQLAKVHGLRRLKRELREELPPNPGRHPRFATKRRVEAMPSSTPKTKREAHQLLERYAELRRSHHAKGSKRSAADFVTLLLKKRLLSSPSAFANTLAQHRVTLDRSDTAQTAASEAQMQAAWDRSDDEAADDESGEVVAEVLTTASRGQAPLTAEERELLNRLGGWVDERRSRPDARAEALLGWLTDICRTADGGWTDERVIIFTEYRDTQKWLVDLLLTHDFGGEGGDRIATLYGGMDTDDRERTKAEFQAHPSRSPERILVATDAASEGIDLQRHCWRMLHWEISVELPSPPRTAATAGWTATASLHPFVEDPPLPCLEGWENDLLSAFATELGFLSRVAYKELNRSGDDLWVGLVPCSPTRSVVTPCWGAAPASASMTDAIDRARSKPATKVLQVERKLREGLAPLPRAPSGDRWTKLNLTPDRVERVVATALDVANQPGILATGVDGEFRLPPLSGSWQASGPPRKG